MYTDFRLHYDLLFLIYGKNNFHFYFVIIHMKKNYKYILQTFSNLLKILNTNETQY